MTILLTLRVSRDGDDIKGVAGVISNLSKVEELDRQRQDLIGMVVHDLRSPLTSIQGFADIMLGGQVKPEYLQIIKRESERMRRMTDVFLDAVRLESRQLRLQLTQQNLADLLRYAVASVSSQAEKNTVLEVRAPSYIPIQADADLISRLMVNLLSNAIKYSSNSKRIITSLILQEEQIKFTVQDEGYGMVRRQQRPLFEKFQRGDNDKSRRITGTGLWTLCS